MFNEMPEDSRRNSHPTRPSSDRIPTVTSGTFDAMVLEGDGRIAVEFMSYGCAHCRAIEPALQQAAETVKSTEKVFKVNVAADPALADRFAIEGTPTFVMFLAGQEVGRVSGPPPSVSSVLSLMTQPFER